MVRRLTLLTPTLALGGTERVVSMMANHWCRLECDVTVITLETPQSDTYPLDPQVERMGLGLMRESRGVVQALLGNLRRVRQLRRAIRQSKPDKVISFTEKMNVVTLLACIGLNVDVIIAERTDPSKHEIGRTWSWLRRLVYRRCRALVVQTTRVEEQMRRIVKHRPIYVIANAAFPPPNLPTESTATDSTQCRVVAMGRLDWQKGFDLLIEAFARLHPEHGDCVLEILGEGPERPNLQRLVEQHGLEERVLLTGWVAEPAAVLRRADLFVLPSRLEGFPNALLEAMACGLPVVSFDCDSGPAEIVRDGVDGLLVPAEDVDHLAAAMNRLLSNPVERQQLAARAPDVLERFSTEQFFAQWEAVLQDAP